MTPLGEHYSDDELRDLGRQFAKIRKALPDLPAHEPRSLHDAPRLEPRPRGEETDMRSPQYRPVFDTGQIASLVAILTTAVGLVWAGSGQVSTFTQQISRQTEQISALRTDINAINASAAERTRYYSPRIDAVERDNQVQNERLSNASASILELRRQGAEMMSILSAMREDIASIKASRYGPGSRRTELIPQAVPATSR